MKFADLVKLSTPLPWEVARDPGGGYGSPWPSNILIGDAGQEEVASMIDNENDAKIAAHCCNNFPKALEALKAVANNSGYCQPQTMKLVHHAIREMEEVN